MKNTKYESIKPTSLFQLRIGKSVAGTTNVWCDLAGGGSYSCITNTRSNRLKLIRDLRQIADQIEAMGK